MAIIKNKAVVKLTVTDAKSKKAAKKAVVELDGFTSYTLDFENSTLVVLGDIDPTVLVQRLRKYVCAKLVTFGPEKDEGKSQKNDGDGGGGNIDQKPPQEQQQKTVYQPCDYGIGTCGCRYGYCYCYY